MKQYVIDQLRLSDYEAIKSYLDENVESSTIEGIYWIPIDPDILTDEQVSHKECQPYYFAIDLDETLMSCELLVRSKNRLRCSCIGYATEKQRNWFIDVIDSILEKIEIQI